MLPGNLTNTAHHAHGSAFLPVAFLPIPKSIIWFIQILLLIMLFQSKQEASREATLPKIYLTIISRLPHSNFCTPQGRNDNSRGRQMSRWSLPTCYLWYWTVYSRLPRASLVGSHHTGLVPKVHLLFLLSGSITNNHQPNLDVMHIQMTLMLKILGSSHIKRPNF